MSDAGPPLQVELLSKVVAYDRNFTARVQGRVQVLILTRAGNSSSEQVARHLQASFDRLERIGNFPQAHDIQHFEDATSLSKQCQERSIDIVYLTPGLEDQLPQIVSALTGLDLLSVSADPAHVSGRVVLGFDLVSGKPKLLVHLGQAKLQNVAFRSDLLKLARVYQ
jgi:hypothetical protein